MQCAVLFVIILKATCLSSNDLDNNVDIIPLFVS